MAVMNKMKEFCGIAINFMNTYSYSIAIPERLASLARNGLHSDN